MKILVLNPPYFKKFSRPQRSPAVTKSGTLYFPIWLAYCAGVLAEDGYDVKLIDAPARNLELDDVLALASNYRPKLIVMDTSTPSINNDITVAEQIKKVLPDSYIVSVGPHVSALPQETLERAQAIDAIARREYEYTIRDLARAVANYGTKPVDKELMLIEGLSFKSSGEIVHNPDRSFIKNLDELPWVSKVYKKYLNIRDYFNPNALYPMVTLITSRGCPFRCSFCVYPQTLTGRRHRLRSIGDVVGEVRYVTREFPEAKAVFFEDDTVTTNKKRCMEFSKAMIDSGVNISWSANSRIDLDYETMVSMKASGCRMLCVGFESGDEDILKTMRKGIQKNRMVRFMQDARRAGILIHGCFMVGFPGETLEKIDKTVDLAIQLNPDTVQFYPVMVYPGTEAFKEYEQKKWITVSDFSRWLTPHGLHNCVVKNETLSPNDLVRICDNARKKFYLRPQYLKYKMIQTVKSPSEFVRNVKAARTFMKYLLFGSDA